MKKAKGMKLGTMYKMNPNEAKKFKTPLRHDLDEPCNALSMVPMSVVNRFKIRPIGVTSKKRAGALVTRRRRAVNSVLDACKLA